MVKKKSSEQITKDIQNSRNIRKEKSDEEKHFQQSKEQEGKQQDWGTKMRLFCKLGNIN